MSYSGKGLEVTLQALDELGIEVVDDSTISAAKVLVADLDRRLREAYVIAIEASVDPGPMHPTHDTWDDHTWFLKTMASQGAHQMGEEREEAQRVLASPTTDDVATVCGLVLHMLHEYIKGSLSLTTVGQRRNHSGSQHAGLPDVFLIWEARNQHQHHLDPPPTDPSLPKYEAGRAAFRGLIQLRPDLFGWPGGSPTDADVTSLMHKKSWAREALIALELSGGDEIRQAIPSL